LSYPEKKNLTQRRKDAKKKAEGMPAAMPGLLRAAVIVLLAAAGETPGESEQLWADLGTTDPLKAEQAVAGLVARPAEAVPFLERRLRSVPAADARRVAGWLADLDSGEFADREEAARRLGQLGEVAVPFLERALRDRPSAEVRRRIRGLLEAVKADRLSPPADRLREARAVEVLERIGDRAARRHLATLAAGLRKRRSRSRPGRRWSG
jgi:hypothetical protein